MLSRRSRIMPSGVRSESLDVGVWRHVRRSVATVGLVLAGIFVAAVPNASASFIYTFSDTDATPYSFSFEVASILTADTDPLAVTPIVATNGTTFTDAALDVGGTTYCFTFAYGTGSAGLCSLSGSAGSGGVALSFTNANMVGTFNRTGGFLVNFSFNEFPDQLVISESTAPEPASLLLLATGGFGYVISRRRRRQAANP